MAQPDPFRLALGATIRARRKELGLTQAELALKIGSSQRRIWEWETGRRDLRLSDSLRPLARGLGMSASALLSAAEVRYEDRNR